MAGEKLQSLPIEERFIELETEGKVVLVPALNKTWVQLADKNFSRYLKHPDPGQSDYIKEKGVWLEITHFVVEDLEWLLRQEHHIFWSHMIFCMEAQWLVLSFLQEGPPYYLRHEFPKDDEMEYLLLKTEHLVFLVLRRLATKRESPDHHIRNLGDLLYNSYLFSIPMFFDIYNLYGFKNRALVTKLFHDVVSISPRFLQDLEKIPAFFIKALQVVKDKFDMSTLPVLNEKSKLKPEIMKNVFLHLLDTCANMHMFFDINTNFAKCMRTEAFLSEIAFFYTYVIPKIHEYIKKTRYCGFKTFKEKLNFIRLNLLSIVRTIFCCTINDIVNDEQNREEYANEYLTRLMDILQEQLFISDYNKVYPIENDLRMLCDLCPNLDTINLKYIIDAVASCSITQYRPDDLKEFRLANLITEVKDFLPHLGDGFVEFCLRFYDFDTQKVVTAIVEGLLPPNLDKLDRNMKRPNDDGQKIVRARINAEKQFRIDKQRTTLEGVLDIGKPGANKYGIHIGKKRSGNEQKTDKEDESLEDEGKANTGDGAAKVEETAKANATAKEEDTAKANVTAKEEKTNKANATAKEEKTNKANATAKDEKTNKANATAKDEKTDKAGPSSGGKQKNKAGPSGGGKQKADKAGSGGGGKQKNKAGPSGGGKPKADKAGPNGGAKQKTEKAEPSDASKQKDKPGAVLDEEMVNVFNNKVEMQKIKNKILNYVQDSENYEDEYDDTYDDKSLLLKEGRNAEDDRKPSVNWTVYRPGSKEYEQRSSDDDTLLMDNTKNVKARLLQRRMDKLRRDFIATKRAQVHEREEMLNRRFKETHKSAMANHNRKSNASKKRNDLGDN